MRDEDEVTVGRPGESADPGGRPPIVKPSKGDGLLWRLSAIVAISGFVGFVIAGGWSLVCMR